MPTVVDLSPQIVRPFLTCSLLAGSGYPRTPQGKRGKWRKKIRQGKHREFGNFAKTQEKHGNLVCSSCKFPDPKVKDISVFAAKISIFSEDLDKAVLCM